MGILLMNIAQISMVLMKTQDAIIEVFKVILRAAIIGVQAITILFMCNGTALNYIRNAISSFMVNMAK